MNSYRVTPLNASFVRREPVERKSVECKSFKCNSTGGLRMSRSRLFQNLKRIMALSEYSKGSTADLHEAKSDLARHLSSRREVLKAGAVLGAAAVVSSPGSRALAW